MDFKENFRLSNGGNELSYDYYNKRQISCLGVALIFRDETNKEVIQYVSYLSEILSHDSLFSGDVLDKFFDELSNNFKYAHIFTDCGPHFRSKKFIYRVKRATEIRNKGISLHFFCEYHGKCIVDGHFGRISDLFKNRGDIRKIDSIYELRDLFELKAKNIFNNVFLRFMNVNLGPKKLMR